MVGRDEAVRIAMKLAADDPDYRDRAVERVGNVFTRDGGKTWMVHLVPEPLDLGDGTFAVDKLGIWGVFVCGQTGRCKWVEPL